MGGVPVPPSPCPHLQSWACSFSYGCTALSWALRGLAQCAPHSQACSGQINLGAAFPDRCWRMGPFPASYRRNAASYQPGWLSETAGDTHNLFGGVQESQTYPYNILNSALSGSAPQPAFPNAAHHCMCSDFCIGLGGKGRHLVASGVVRPLANRGENSLR